MKIRNERAGTALDTRARMTGHVRLGLRADAPQFVLLVGLNALVGGMVGLERSVLPLVGKDDFGLSSTSVILAFVVAFGAARPSRTWLPAGWPSASAASGCSDRLGGGVAGAAADPGHALVLADRCANLLLGVNQGLAWSVTLVMKIHLAGPRRRGLALGLNESAGYLGVAVTAFLSGALAATYARR